MYFILCIVILAVVNSVSAYPGMGELVGQIRQNYPRQDDEFDDSDSTELIGDLLTLADEDLTRVGLNVKNIILGTIASHTNEVWAKEVPALGTPECAAETCCVWQYIANELEVAFREADGRCTALARAAVRLGFHVSAKHSRYRNIVLRTQHADQYTRIS